jgi:Tfp pilus assembly protein PilN
MPATKKLNLLPKNDFNSGFSGKFIKWAVNVGRWIIVFTELIVILAFLSRFYFDTELANLFDETKQKQAILVSAASFEENFRQIQNKVKNVSSLLSVENKLSMFLSEIEKIIPIDTNLTQVGLTKDSISLSGYTLSEDSLRVFVNGIKSFPRAKQVSLSDLSRKKNSSDIIFNITISLKDESGK